MTLSQGRPLIQSLRLFSTLLLIALTDQRYKREIAPFHSLTAFARSRQPTTRRRALIV
jgi:hypothetical protein